MTALPIAFRTNESKYKFSGVARLINCYAEAQGTDAKSPYSILPCYGMTLEREVTDTPCRGLIYLPDLDCIYAAHSSSIYKITETGAATRIGTLPGFGTVQFSRNQATSPQINAYCGCTSKQYYIENDLVKEVTDEHLPTSVSQDHIGGYTAYGLEDRRIFLSGLNQTEVVDPLDFATAELSPDPLVRLKADGDLFVFKKYSTEQWRVTGNEQFPLEPLPALIKRGLLARFGVTAFDNTLAFVGDDGVVYRITGPGTIQRISTHGIERNIADESSQSSILAFAHGTEGHSFATFVGTDWTRSYDAATGFWHSRESYQIGKWRARFPVKAWGKTIVGDTLTGNLYYLDKDAHTESGNPLVWGVDTPIFHVFPNGGIIDALYIDCATGVGLISGQGSDPKLMLSWSTDGGNTFKGNRELSLGARGDRVRVKTNRLGRFGPQGVQFRLRVSDPVIRSLIGLDVRVRPLSR